MVTEAALVLQGAAAIEAADRRGTESMILIMMHLALGERVSAVLHINSACAAGVEVDRLRRKRV